MDNILSYLLSILIAMQSIVAVADMHPFQSTDTPLIPQLPQSPLSTVHTDNDLIVSSPISPSAIHVYSCHHCCYCHNICGVYLGYYYPQFNLELFVQSLPEYHFSQLKHHSSPALRPPIV